MGSLLSHKPKLLEEVVPYLSPSQVRVVLSMSRVSEEATQSIYQSLINRIVGALEKHRIRAARDWKFRKWIDKLEQACEEQRQKETLAKENNENLQQFEYRAYYWRLQRHICEVCLKRRSCTRSSCKKCVENGRPSSALCIDICCVCAKSWTSPKKMATRMRAMVKSAELWQSRGISYEGARGPNLAHFAFELDFGGLVRIDSFLTQEHRYFSCINELRLQRQYEKSLHAILLNRFSGRDDWLAFDMLLRSDGHTFLARAGYKIMLYFRHLWKQYSEVNDPAFFKWEDAILSFVGRFLRFLHVVDRFKNEINNFGTQALKACADSGLTAPDFLCLDSLAHLVIGETFTGQALNKDVASCLARQMYKCWLFPLLQSAQAESRSILSVCKERDFLLADFGNRKLLSGGYEKFSPIEVWCCDPEYVREKLKADVQKYPLPDYVGSQPFSDLRKLLESVDLDRQSWVDELRKKYGIKVRTDEEKERRRQKLLTKKSKLRRTLRQIEKRRQKKDAIESALPRDKNYENWSKAKLKKALAELGADVQGIKPRLVLRLKALKESREP